MRNNNASAPTGDGRQGCDYRERCAVAANMHAFEARGWQRKLDADPTDEDARIEVADETRRSKDMAALASALDALAEAVKGCGKRLWDDVHCGDTSVVDTAILCAACDARLWSAITQLLAGRGTR